MRERGNILRSTFVGLLLLTGFYLMTAIVYDEEASACSWL